MIDNNTYLLLRNHVHCTSYSIRGTVYVGQYMSVSIRRSVYVGQYTSYTVRHIVYVAH